MKPPFAYYGGKTGMAPLIAGLLPPHRVYIEPFFGSGAVLFAKRPSVHEIVNDLDGAVVNFFRVLREREDELHRVCALTPYARDEFAAADLDEPGLDDLERARRFWVRVNQSFAKTAGRRTGWSVTTARTQSTANAVIGRLGRFRDAAARLATVVIEHCDGIDLVERLATSDTAIYVDPTYDPASRRTAADDYRVEMGGEAAHRRLAEVLRSTPAAVVLSGYPGRLYDELYGDWLSFDVPVSVHSSNARTRTREGRIERIWSNRDLDRGRLPFPEVLA